VLSQIDSDDLTLRFEFANATPSMTAPGSVTPVTRLFFACARISQTGQIRKLPTFDCGRFQSQAKTKARDPRHFVAIDQRSTELPMMTIE
jgi:hypothetical protein